MGVGVRVGVRVGVGVGVGVGVVTHRSSVFPGKSEMCLLAWVSEKCLV